MEISKLSKNDYEDVLQVWEASVRATHDFLEEGYLQYLKGNIPSQYLPMMELFGIKDEGGRLLAFLGVSSCKIEVLFVSPDEFGKGLGSRLLRFAVDEIKIRLVDVNEENRRALSFYEKRGFKIISRDDVDSEGWAHPILHLEL